MNLIYSHITTVEPAIEPITLEQAKLYLRVDNDDEDDLINALITMARQHVENHLNRALITQTRKLFLSRFPYSTYSHILLPRANLQSITSITFIDGLGALQTWAPSNYRVDTSHLPGLVLPEYNSTYPNCREIPSSVSIEYVCGYGATADLVPEPIKLAMRLLLTHLYENRSAVIVGTGQVKLDFGVESLLHFYRVGYEGPVCGEV